MLRFPGGTIGNWYNWKKDYFEDIHPAAPDYARDAIRVKNEGRKYGYEDFVKLTRKYGIEPIIVVNMFTQTPDEAAEWFAQMKRTGFRVRYCELGNEVYFLGRTNRATASVAGYISVSKRFVRALRKVDPELKIAVCAARLDGLFEEWNNALARENYYDAVIHHEYIGPRDDIIRSSTVKRLLAGERAIDRTVREFRKVFGDRKLWITEWNLPNKAGKELRHTGLSALYLASRYLRMLDHDETLEVALTHVLCGALFGAFTISGDGTVTKSTDFAVWKLIGMATDGCEEMLDTTVTPSERANWSFQMSNARAFSGKNGIRILFVNKLPIKRRVNIIIDGKPWRGRGRLHIFSVQRLSQRPNIPFFTSGIRTAPFTAPYELPPYSINLIELQ